MREFFGEQLGRQLGADGQAADLIVGNNVYAHVPDINDFTRRLKAALKPGGTITLEFPHLMRLIEHVQFDTVYHEHFSYLSLHTVEAHLRRRRLARLRCRGAAHPWRQPARLWLPRRRRARRHARAVGALLARGSAARPARPGRLSGFPAARRRVKDDLLLFLIEQKRAGEAVAAYGAAAKGNTLLNYAGVKPDLCRSSAMRRRPSRANSCRAAIFRSLPPPVLDDARRLSAGPAVEPRSRGQAADCSLASAARNSLPRYPG